MSIVYNGAHSIYFKKHSIDPILAYNPNIGKYYYLNLPGDVYTYANSWTYFHMVPATRHFVVPPEPRLQFVNIPRSNRILDVTNSLASNVIYEASEGDWEFIIDHDKYSDWSYAYDAISDFFDGSWFEVWLGDQLNYRYTGRIYANTYRPGEDYSRINLHYIFDVNLYDEINPYDGPDAPAPDPGPDPDPDPDPQPVDYLVTDYEDDLVMNYELTTTGNQYNPTPIYVEKNNRATIRNYNTVQNYKISFTPSWNMHIDSTSIQSKYIIVRRPKAGGGSTYEVNSLSTLKYDSTNNCYVKTFDSSILKSEISGQYVSVIYVGSAISYDRNHSIHVKIEHLHSGSEIIL